MTDVIGTSFPRLGAVERVTGAQAYAADIRLDNALHVKLVSLACAHARIVAVHHDNAARVPGVRGIFTANDLPQPVPRYGPVYADRPMLASGETKFSGEPVAAVVADTLDAAHTAAQLVRIDFVELPAVLSIDAALDANAPLVQDAALRPNDPLARTNTLQQWQFGWGDVDGATAGAPNAAPASGWPAELVVEHDYTFPMVTHFAIEPHAFLAAPDANGVTVWSPTQHPYVLQRVIAAALQWPIARVRVVAPDPGGGFGGKGWPKVEPLMAWLALRLGQPVRLVLTLEETFQAARRTSARIHARTGFARDGRIIFQDIHANFLLGAYADIGTRVVSKASYSACGPYRAAHARITARALLSHTTPSTAFRGFGTPQAAWAVESQLNEAAAALGIDPVEIRRRNLPAKGEAFNPNDTPADGDWNDALTKAAAAIAWDAPLAPNRGRGISLGLKSSSTASRSVAIVRLHFDGSASVLCGTSDMGQGARTVMMQIAAQELGLRPDRVAIVMGDTSVVPFDSSTSASRSTVFMGNAIIEACDSIKKQLRQIAEAKPATTVAQDFSPAGERSPADLLKAHFGPPRGEIIGIGEAGNAYEPGHPLGGRAAFWELMCASCEVEVDPDTGETTIHKLVLVSDVGKALNPQQVEGQDEGAAVMGLGHTLMEQLVLGADGRILNLGSLDYRIPSIKDVPLQLESHLIENADGPGPYGSKGAGEGGTLAVAAAIGAAINQAAGVTIRDLPLTPEKIWRARNEKRSARNE
jgi:CO/xanthine dehydrogenase Mo-binding subunit